MSDQSVGRRYAQAFLEVAEEAKLVDQLGQQLRAFTDIATQGDALLYRAMANPVFTIDERRAVLEQVLAKVELHAYTANLLRVMLEKRRFASLPHVATLYSELADEHAGRVNVAVTTASPLTPQLQAEIRDVLERTTGKSVTLQSHVDPSLIGGMVARVGGTVYDASLKSRLQDIKTALLAAAV